MVFGCETLETGEIFSQEADGIMGLGNSEVSVINQVCQFAMQYHSFMKRNKKPNNQAICSVVLYMEDKYVKHATSPPPSPAFCELMKGHCKQAEVTDLWGIQQLQLGLLLDTLLNMLSTYCCKGCPVSLQDN